ncbi:MAG: hypothetical protein JRE18_11045, partial [Deltaproteobacteria bacterium]|nr:hypothetical protein [Deltaproteobacteria bacterium]
MSLLAELRRRNVFKVAAAYLLASWVVIEVASVILPILEAPQWLLRALLFAVVLGLPIVLVFSWVFEITPEGLMKTEAVAPERSITAVTGRRLNYAIIGLLVIAVAVLTVTHSVFDQPSEPARPPQNSIAVLPFANLSPDPDQAYFSDGLAEELLNLLAKIPELRVTSRTSAFSFRDAGLDVPTVAARLNVAHVLEGSVRRSGDTVRITAQLIDARRDVHLWSEVYDRPLTDIFAVQDEIAAAVVTALEVQLLHGAPKVSATDPEAYALFLQARHAYRQGSPDSFLTSERLLQRSLAIEPDYAPAWEALSTVYSYQVITGLLPYADGRANALRAAERALDIEPGYAPAHGHLGWDAMTNERDYVAAAAHFRRARSLAPRNAAVLGNSG